MKKVLTKILKEESIAIILIIIFVALNIYLQTLPSKTLGNIIDLLYNIGENKDKIINNIYFLLLISLLFMIVRVIWKFLLGFCTRKIEKDLKDNLFKHYLSTSLTSTQDIKNGEIMTYLVKDIGEIRGALYRILSHGTRMLFVFLIATYTMLSVDRVLTVSVICPIIFTLLIITVLKRYVEKSFKKAQKYFTNVSEYVQESTDSIRTTKAYSTETSQLKKFIKKNNLLKRGNIAVDTYSTLLSVTVSICFGFCYGITILYGSRLVLNGKISIGQFVAFNGYIDMFYSPIVWLPGVISKLQRAIISYKRLDKVFALKKENIKLSAPKGSLSGDILINNLSFTYPNTFKQVLQNINLKIPQGSTLGIIGTIGSGKTTLMNLLVKLYDVPNGTISLNGTDINDLDLNQLRNSFCYITQDNFLFSNSIKENIRLFKTGINDEEIIDSAEKAMLAEDLARMENSLDTVVGERGIDLSGGQKQRVVISRAFLNKSNYLIFDDTFSALDNKTEKILLENIRKQTKDKTVIIISNRISDVKAADNIIVLDDGKIIESGKHKELIKSKKLYYKFYKQQSSHSDDSLLS